MPGSLPSTEPAPAPRAPEPGDERLAVLLATYNGARFLDEQLRSLAEQDWPGIDVWASDDGSSDGTVEILERWRARWAKGTFVLRDGPRQGAYANFRALLTGAPIDAAFVAFCDQDDIWLPGKTRVSVAALRGAGCTPALFGSRTVIVDEDDEPVGLSPRFAKPPHFRNALVQSICGGNTMTLNRPAFDALRAAAQRCEFVAHDWFAYQIVTAVGGAAIYSADPLVRYRQHTGNVVGSNAGTRARLARLRLALDGRFAAWTDTNLTALRACRSMLSAEAIETLEQFERARAGSLASRLSGLRRAGVYRQTAAGQMSLYLACALGKM